MLSDEAVQFLEPLKYTADADRRTCLIPLGGIYWADDIPDFKQFLRLPEAVQTEILRLFSIRFRIWKSVELEPDEVAYFSDARSQLPSYAIFRRLILSSDDLGAQEQVEQDAVEFFDALVDGADKVTLTTQGSGVQSFAAEFDLTKDESKEPIWRRLFELCRRGRTGAT